MKNDQIRSLARNMLKVVAISLPSRKPRCSIRFSSEEICSSSMNTSNSPGWEKSSMVVRWVPELMRGSPFAAR